MDPGSQQSVISTSSIVSVIFLLLAAWYFAAVETAFASISRSKLKARFERGDRRAKKALFILDNFDDAITTILIGTNITHIVIGAIVTVEVTRHLGVSFVTISTIITAIVVFFFSEMLPKSVAKKFSEPFSLATASSLMFFMKIFAPLAHAISKVGGAIARALTSDKEVSVTEDELYDIIEDMTSDGSLDTSHGELMSSALQFSDLKADMVVTARVDVAAIDVDWDDDKIINFINEHKHSRIPVYEDNIDHIIGVLHIRKFLKEYFRRGGHAEVRDFLDEPYFVHRSVKISELLNVMSAKKINLAIITDNYGGTLGIVTIEDILEELVGEIWDEDDVVEESFMPLGGGRYEADAELTLEEVFDKLDFDPKVDDEDFEFKTLGEWAYETFSDIPSERDSFVYKGLKVTVSSMSKNRILKLVLKVLDEEESGGDEQ